jgi:acyl-CoA synthetase (AMP-forming)/AMP-acid ligase II
VVGRQHAVLGEEPVAFVALRNPGSVTPAELLERCSASLARYKVPRDLVILDTLPKNALGKIAKPELRQLVTTA